MRWKGVGGAVLVVVVSTACEQASEAGLRESGSSESSPESVWAIDLVRTLPGGQSLYVENIERNWASARDVALSRGAIRSYRALVAPRDSVRGWDVMLITEYSDSTAFRNREAIFESIFESPDYERFDIGVASSELRDFFQSEVTMKSVAGSR